MRSPQHPLRTVFPIIFPRVIGIATQFVELVLDSFVVPCKSMLLIPVYYHPPRRQWTGSVESAAVTVGWCEFG